MNRWVMSAVVAGCAVAEGSVDASDRYVGSVEGFSGATRIAVVVEGEHWLAYACGDSGRINEAASRWWKGSSRGESFTANEEGVSLTAKVDGGKIVGAVRTQDGASHSFIADKVAAGARAGVYRATATSKSGDYQLSWIVDAEGFVVGCKKGNGKRVALKPARLAPPTPKPAVRRKPKPVEESEADDEEPAEKSAKEAAEEDAEPKASADEDGESEAVVGKKVVSAKPAKAAPAAKKAAEADDSENEEEQPAKKTEKKKPADDEDGD